MVQYREYRVTLPFSIEEYKIAQLYMVAKYSASESSGDTGDGVEIVKNEPYDNEQGRGQYTQKVYHLASKLPSWVVALLPSKALRLEEEAWNAFPHCKTVLRCPALEKFSLTLETRVLPDRGDTENALNMDAKTLKKRHTENVDIATDPVEKYVQEEDPCKFQSKKTGRGPLAPGWQKTCEPVLTAYKLCTVDVPYWGFGTTLEKFIAKNAQHKVLLEGHRKCFCWLDEWYGLTIEDIRRMERETAETIRKARARALGEEVEAEVAAPKGGVEENGVAQPAKASAAAAAPATPDTSLPEGPRRLSIGDRLKSSFRRSSSGGRSSRSPRTSDTDQSPKLVRRLSNNLTGPAVTVGFLNVSALELDEAQGATAVAFASVPSESLGHPTGELIPTTAPASSARVGPQENEVPRLPAIQSCAELENADGKSEGLHQTEGQRQNGVVKVGDTQQLPM